jgi:hypothetical protein
VIAVRKSVSWRNKLIASILAVTLPLLLFSSCGWLGLEEEWYTTENLKDYRIVKWNGHNEIPQAFIDSFFPEKIEPYFRAVQYKYTARDWCDYCCEMYLEFTIEDEQTYREYVAGATENLTGETFPFAQQYTAYTIHDRLPVSPDAEVKTGENGETVYYIDNARMGKILTCDAEHKIIYVAIMVTACCGDYTDKFDFYSRFDIDPKAYAEYTEKQTVTY